MVPERTTELLCAYLDGELNTRQRQQVEKLLRKSAQARALFEQLQSDARRLRGLPAPTAPDFTPRVLHAIAEGKLRPAPARPTPAVATRMSVWYMAAIAASLFLAVTAASYLFFSLMHRGDEPAVTDNTTAPSSPDRDKDAAPANVEPRHVPETPFVLAKLSQESERARLVQVLRQEPSYHLSVSTRNTTVTVSQLQKALARRGFQIELGPAVQDKLGKPSSTTYLLYAENLYAQELQSILEQLGTEGGSASTANVAGMTADHRQQLATLIGVPHERLGPPPPKVDSISRTGIGDHSGDQRQPKQPVPTGKRFAMVLAYDDAHPERAADPRLRGLFEQRPQQEAGTLQVVLVIRTA
jgi:hypothetical protein